MPHLKLTKRAIGRLPAPTKSGKPEAWWDQGPRAVTGFGVLCSGVTPNKSFIAQRDLPGGKTRRVTIGGVNELTLDKARAQAAEFVQAMRRGVDPKAAKRQALTLTEALDAYCAAGAHRLRPRTVAHYRDTVARHLADWADRPLAEITRAMVEARHKKIAQKVEAAQRAAAARDAARHEARAKRVAKSWPEAAAAHRAKAAAAAARTPASGEVVANNAARILRMVWNDAKDHDPTSLGPDNPVRLGKNWFEVPSRERHVSTDDLPKFYAAVMALENPVQRDYLRLLLFTGLRRREAAQLRWADVDLKKRTLRIPAAVAKADRKLDLPLTDQLLDMLVARRALGDGKFVFPANSKSGHVEEPKFALDQIAKEGGVRVSVHDLRRTFITHAASATISVYELKCLVNHARDKTDVTATYVQLGVEGLREPAQKVADKIAELCGITAPTGENVAELLASQR